MSAMFAKQLIYCRKILWILEYHIPPTSWLKGICLIRTVGGINCTILHFLSVWCVIHALKYPLCDSIRIALFISCVLLTVRQASRNSQNGQFSPVKTGFELYLAWYCLRCEPVRTFFCWWQMRRWTHKTRGNYHKAWLIVIVCWGRLISFWERAWEFLCCTGAG